MQHDPLESSESSESPEPSVEAGPPDAEQHAQQFEALLMYLKRARGLDFSGYKRPSLMRRIVRRMQAVGITDFERYTDYLEVHPDEFTLLFNHILINVTTFFRDQPSWEYLRAEIVPKIVESRPENEPIRIWSAGCASGQETYSLAMVFAEALGTEAFQQRVKIYASDVDEEALAEARQGSYPAKEIQELPQDLQTKYFEFVGNRYEFRQDLRRSIIFGRHDLLSDAPISRLDLLSCRNTFMYFNAETQNRILARFHFALKDKGYLFLGRAEMLLSHVNLFEPVEFKHRIFRKLAKVNLRDRLLIFGPLGDEDAAPRLIRQLRLRELSFETDAVPQIMVETDGDLAQANEQARLLFNITAKDIGRPFRDLEISYRPIELRSLIEQAYAERRAIHRIEVPWSRPDKGTQYFNIDIVPLEDAGQLLGISVTFRDVSNPHYLQAELLRTKQELETAYEELQSTNEELETTNEELQSTVEELETTNEELQSTNEELETMNEELQSTNEELQTVNAELRERTDEGIRTTLFLESILSSLRCGVAVIDERLNILIWNERAADLWGLREEEVKGTSFLSLDIGLPVEPLRTPMRRCLSGETGHEVMTIPCVNRRGKTMTCRVSVAPLASSALHQQGVIIVMDPLEKHEAES